MNLPYLETKGMLLLEKLAAEEFGLSVDQMMEQAGSSLSQFVLGELPDTKRILIVAGKGNNGGDALAAGEFLKKKGLQVDVFKPGDAISDFGGYDLIIDGLFGFSLRGNARPPADEVIRRMNESGTPVLSVDVPSGLEVFSGNITSPTVEATWTMALGMPKRGLDTHRGQAGEILLGDLGIPKGAYERGGFAVPDFSSGPYIHL